MTEDEAKTKLCCGPWMGASVRGAEVAISLGNTPVPSTGMCRASACMAWRKYIPFGSHEPERSTSGYCGLAGRPE